MRAPGITDPEALLYAGRTGEQALLNPTEADVSAHTTMSGQAPLNAFLAGVENRAYQVAYGALWEREAALDVVQDAMLRFVEYYRDKPEKDWPALFRTVLNSKINDQRRKRLLGNTTRKLLSLTGFGQARETAQDSMAESELPRPVREDGFSQPEAGVTDQQLKRHIASALGRLAER